MVLFRSKNERLKLVNERFGVVPVVRVFEHDEKPSGRYVLLEDIQERIKYQRNIMDAAMKTSGVLGRLGAKVGLKIYGYMHDWVSLAWNDLEEEKR